MSDIMRYVRDRKGNKVGMLVGVAGNNGMVHIGWSRCMKGEKFDREAGRDFCVVNLGKPVPHSMLRDAKQFRAQLIMAEIEGNPRIQEVKAMEYKRQQPVVRGLHARNSGHRKGCLYPSGGDCTCRQIAKAASQATVNVYVPVGHAGQES
jgi:hypothetical protein